MKVLGFVLVVLFAFSSFADNHEKGEKLEAKKQIKLEAIDKRIAALQTKKTCISGAADRKAMKQCHKTHKESMKGVKKEMKEKMKALKKG